MRSVARMFGRSQNAFSAHEVASSYRPAKKWANAVTPCIVNINGSRGLSRIARRRCSIATSGSPPRNALTVPLAYQAVARFGFSESARSTSARAPVARNITQRKPAEGECNRVILAQLRREAGETGGLSHLLRAIGGPAAYLAHYVAERRRAIGRSKIIVEFDRLGKQFQRVAGTVLRYSMCTRHSAQKVVVSVKAVGGLALGALDLGLFQLPRDCADHAFGDTILQIEDVLDAAVKMICPEMHALAASTS